MNQQESTLKTVIITIKDPCIYALDVSIFARSIRPVIKELSIELVRKVVWRFQP